jgi:F-type H+-transporting ATPase subunit gamma
MPTLKEIKGRIASVRSTLKITSAMKLVSSAKLRKAQNAIEAMRPYEEQLLGILASLQGGTAGVSSLNLAQNKDERKTIVAIASNSSLCGGFNANAIAKVRAIRRPGDTVYAIGRKMADAMRKEGFASPEDFSALSEHPSYGPAAALVEKLVADVEAGRTGAVVLVYNHFVSTARQEPVVEVLIQRETPNQVGGDRGAGEESLSGTFSRTGSRSDVEEGAFPSEPVDVRYLPG